MSLSQLGTIFGTLNMVKSSEKLPYTLASLIAPINAEGKSDITSRWKISFWVWSEVENKKVRVLREYKINQVKTLRERKNKAKEIIATINGMLKEGYVITKDTKAFEPAIKFESTVDVKSLTLTGAIDQYVEDNKTTLSPNTLRGYTNLNNVLSGWLKSNKIEGIKLVSCHIYYDV